MSPLIFFQRFNVAITRPKELLIIVGNADVLYHDDCWRSMIEYCQDGDSFVGDPFLEDTTDETSEMWKNLEILGLVHDSKGMII